MKIQSELCHVNDKQIIVKVIGIDEGIEVASALGEGETTEAAQDNALERLKKHINYSIESNSNNEKNNKTTTSNSGEIRNDLMPNSKDVPVKLPLQQNNQKPNLSEIPLDWSNELSIYEFEIKRIGWLKNEEEIVLSNIFGYSSRTMITDFRDLQIIIAFLKKIDSNKSPNDLEIFKDREVLINESNQILLKLKWDTSKARIFLYDHFNVNSRNELNDRELLKFNILLESNGSENS